MENKGFYNILCEYLSKEDQDKINKEINERYKEFSKNKNETLDIGLKIY